MKWEKIKVGFWGAVGGAIIFTIIGFSWGGWILESTAQKMAADAVVDRLVPMCVTQFHQDAEKEQKLKALKETSSWQRKDYVVKQGWATMPGEKNTDNRVADKCTNRIMQELVASQS